MDKDLIVEALEVAINSYEYDGETIKVQELTAFNRYLKALQAGDINADTFAELTINLTRGEK